MPFTCTKIGHCAISTVGCRCAERLSFQVFRHDDTAALSADHREWRPVVEHEHSLDRRARLGVAELDQGINVAEAHVVITRCHALDRLDRVGGGIYRDIEAFRFVIALVERQQEERGRPFEFVVEREFNDCFRRLRRRSSTSRQSAAASMPTSRCGEPSSCASFFSGPSRLFPPAQQRTRRCKGQYA